MTGTDGVMHPLELRMVREGLGLTTTALAVALDVGERTIRQWETGKHPIPAAAHLGDRPLVVHDRLPGLHRGARGGDHRRNVRSRPET